MKVRTVAPILASLLVVGAPAAAGEVRENLMAPSSALGHDLPFSIYLPEEFQPDGARYPVVYLLHGYGGGQREWLAGGRIEATLDRLIQEDIIAPVIAIMPDAAKSWYVDSAQYGGPGDYETAIVRDLVRHVDQTFPTDPEKRAIAGLSMGGFGALRLAFSYPESFSAVVALSPAIFKPDGVSAQAFPTGLLPGDLERWFPNTTGERFDRTVYEEQNPFSLIDDLAARDNPPPIMLTVGDDDFFKLYDGTLEFYLELRAQGLTPELRVADGGHDWDYWRRVTEDMILFVDSAWKEHEQQ